MNLKTFRDYSLTIQRSTRFYTSWRIINQLEDRKSEATPRSGAFQIESDDSFLPID